MQLLYELDTSKVKSQFIWMSRKIAAISLRFEQNDCIVEKFINGK